MLNQKDAAVSVMQEFFPNGGRDFDDACALFDAIAAGKVPGVFVRDAKNPVGIEEAQHG